MTIDQDVTIDGRAVSARVRSDVAAGVALFRDAHGRAPGLATVLVGDDPASEVYIRMKHRACAEVDMVSKHVQLEEMATQAQVEAAIRVLVADPAIDGILVQLPLPEHLDVDAVLDVVPPEQDVDGFHPYNIGGVALGRDAAIASCTPAGVMMLLDSCGVELEGAEAVVVGRSRTVGMPMALLLLNRDATVTVTHHLTHDLAAATRRADVLVVAAGVPGLITADMVKPGAVVIDVGTTRTDDGLKGDVDFDGVREVASRITPVPGGVGPMTIAMLLRATLELARARVGDDGGRASL